MSLHYDLTEVLTKKDLDNREPDIILIESNRSDGKTTAVLQRLIDVYKAGGQIGLVYRYQYELKSAHEIFESAMKLKNMSKYVLQSVAHANGLFYEILICETDENKKIVNANTLGYAFGLNNPDGLKKYSPLFANVQELLFDEFQTENGKYLNNESQRLLSVLTSIARGNGQKARKIKLYMCANKVSIMNPYYIEFGIYKRKRAETKFLRGHGWVAHFNFNENASKAIKETGFGRAFEQSNYIKYATEDVYLYDSMIFIEKPTGKARYLCTIIHDNERYGVREYFDKGVVFISHKPDNSCLNVITFKANDHTQNSMMLSKCSYTWKAIRDAFQKGILRFDDVKSKNAIFEILSVDIYG